MKELRKIKTLLRREGNKRTGIKKQGITTVISLNFLESWERVPQERIAREETVSTEVTVRSSNLNCKMMRPNYQSSTGFKFRKSRYKIGELIITITMKYL